MDLSRRNLLRAAGVTGGLVAAGGLADAAVAGVLTAAAATRSQVILKGAPGVGGYRPLVYGAGEPTTVRTNLGITAKKGRKKRREGLLAFAQLTDVHIVDAQSPLRFESQDKNFSSSAYRPQEFLTAHVAEAMVQEINAVGKGPVTELPLALALQTGDNSDNGQYNEIRWNIDLLDGETVAQDSGDLTRYEGVADDNATYYTRGLLAPARHARREGRRHLPVAVRLPDGAGAPRRLPRAVPGHRPGDAVVRRDGQPRRALPGQLPPHGRGEHHRDRQHQADQRGHAHRDRRPRPPPAVAPGAGRGALHDDDRAGRARLHRARTSRTARPTTPSTRARSGSSCSTR